LLMRGSEALDISAASEVSQHNASACGTAYFSEIAMSVPVVMEAAEQILAQRVLLVVRMSSLCPI
jgi:hypothetical protein